MCTIKLVFTTIFFILLEPISTVKCPSCFNISVDIFNKTLSTTAVYCNEISESTAVCKSELLFELTDTYPAIINYITAPSNALIVSNGDSESVLTINIPFDTVTPYGSFLYDCYDKDLCNNKIVETQYETLSALNFTTLQTELIELLYNDQIFSKQKQTECYNRNNNIEKCSSNGICQATLVIEQGRPDLITTTCIPDGRPGSTIGLSFYSKTVGNNYQVITISYTCNKNRCNDPVKVRKTRQLLADINLVHSRASSLNFLSIVFPISYFLITNIWFY